MPPDDTEIDSRDPQEIREENARLRSDLELARRREAEERGRADSLDVQVSQSASRTATAQLGQVEAQLVTADNIIDSIGREMASLKAQKSALMAEGKFDEAADVDERMADAAASRQQALQAKQSFTNQRERLANVPVDPVEQFIAANQGNYSAEDVAWIRQHRRFATDRNFSQRVAAAHAEALEGGIRHRSPEYYAHLERRGYMLPDPAPAQQTEAAPTGHAGGDATSDVEPEIIIRNDEMPANGEGAFGRRAEQPQQRAAGNGSMRAAIAAAPSRRSFSQSPTGRRTLMEFTESERDTAMRLAATIEPQKLQEGEIEVLRWYDTLRNSGAANRVRQGWLDRRQQ